MSKQNMEIFINPLLTAHPELCKIVIVFPSRKVHGIDIIFLNDDMKVPDALRRFDLRIVMASVCKSGDDGLKVNIEESVENHLKKKTTMSSFVARVLTAYPSMYADALSTQIAYFKLWAQEPKTIFYLNER